MLFRECLQTNEVVQLVECMHTSVYKTLASQNHIKPCVVVAQACNPIAQEAETGGSEIQCHVQLHSDFEASQR